MRISEVSTGQTYASKWHPPAQNDFFTGGKTRRYWSDYPYNRWKVAVKKVGVPCSKRKDKMLNDGVLVYCDFLKKEYVIPVKLLIVEWGEYEANLLAWEEYQRAAKAQKDHWNKIHAVQKEEISKALTSFGMQDISRMSHGSGWGISDRPTSVLRIKADQLLELFEKAGLITSPFEDEPVGVPYPKRDYNEIY